MSLDHARLILAFLRSDSVRALAYGTAGLQRLSLRDLRCLTLPSADEALSAALEELSTAGQRMNSWSAEAATLANSVYDTGPNPENARRSIIELGQLTRLRAEAAAQLDEPAYIFRTRLPYPIALRWREVEARLSANDTAPAYDAVLEAAEALLGYGALGAVSRIS